MTTCIVNYEAGNLGSVLRALRAVGTEGQQAEALIIARDMREHVVTHQLQLSRALFAGNERRSNDEQRAGVQR